jgi:GNAT superfamily N-acetyltransferase
MATVPGPAPPAAAGDVVELADGRPVEVRALGPDETVTALDGLGEPGWTSPTAHGGLAIVDEHGEIVGVAALGDRGSAAARATIVVRADWRQAGAGRLLLSRLVEEGTRRGLDWLVGSYPFDNQAATRLVAGSGLVVARRVVAGTTTAALQLRSSRQGGTPTHTHERSTP